MSETVGIESLQKVVLVADTLLDSLSAHFDRGEDWGTWDFVQDVGPDLVIAVGSAVNIPAEVQDLSREELSQLVQEMTDVLKKAIMTIGRGKK